MKLLGSNVQLVHKELLILLQDDALEVSPPPRRHQSTCCLHVHSGVFLLRALTETCFRPAPLCGATVGKASLVLLLEVLDALMDHLEETLEMVISKGENPVLDNKGVKVLS